MNLTTILTAAAPWTPWVGFGAFLTAVVWAAGRQTVAEANRAALLTWCRVIGGGTPPPPDAVAKPVHTKRQAPR